MHKMSPQPIVSPVMKKIIVSTNRDLEHLHLGTRFQNTAVSPMSQYKNDGKNTPLSPYSQVSSLIMYNSPKTRGKNRAHLPPYNFPKREFKIELLHPIQRESIDDSSQGHPLDSQGPGQQTTLPEISFDQVMTPYQDFKTHKFSASPRTSDEFETRQLRFNPLRNTHAVIDKKSLASKNFSLKPLRQSMMNSTKYSTEFS